MRWSARHGIYAAVAVNTVLALALGLALSASGPRIFASLQRDFPSDRLVLDNRGPPLDSVRLELDGRFGREVLRLEPGKTDLELRSFRDREGRRPRGGQAPKRLQVHHQGGVEVIEVVRIGLDP